MKRHYHTDARLTSRRDVCAWVRGGGVGAQAAATAAVVMQSTVPATKINPRWMSGGLLTEESL